jgi:endonuclease III
MKDSKTYSKKVQQLHRSLKRKYPKAQSPVYDEPVRALVNGIVNENMSERAAQSALKRFDDYFVDLNDLRVSRIEEIVELLGEDTAATRGIAVRLTETLRAVFDKYNVVSLASLRKMGKRPAKRALEKMAGMTPFVVHYCMLTSLQGHAIPLTAKMVEYLRGNEFVHPEADEQEIEGFLARQISSSNGYEFYALLRLESEKRKRTTRKTALKAKKKATTKKKKKKARQRKA